MLADGSLVRCSKKENRDLFDALPWSYGTLGLLVSVTLSLVPCKPYIKIEYHPCTTKASGVAKFTELSEADDAADFVEALGYSAEHMVVMPAWFATEAEAKAAKAPINRIGLWYKPWFYKHVASLLHN